MYIFTRTHTRTHTHTQRVASYTRHLPNGAQVLPKQGSPTAHTFFVVDAVITGLFALELLFNLFGHSHQGFHPFYSRAANWFDLTIVTISVVNVIVTASGGKLANAKLLRLMRIGRVVRLFTSLKGLNRLLTAVSHAVRARACGCR